jgi:hypothetical protein
MVEDPLKQDFRQFLYHVWSHLGFPRPTKIQLDMARFLQHGGSQVMLQAFRGVGKSWVTAAFVVWLLFVNPNLNILVVSASKAHADNTTTFCLQIIKTIPELAHLIPRPDQREAKVQFDVGPARNSRDPSMKSVGITGMLTGSRADVIIADDIETSQNSQTQMMREKLKTSIEEFAAILKPDSEYSRIVYLGTPQCEDSIYRGLPAKGYTIRIWPARYPSQKVREGYERWFAPLLAHEMDSGKTKVGDPTEPERFPEDVLAKKEAEYARSGFALQFMLDTSLADTTRYPLKLSDFIVMDLNPDIAPPKVVWGRAPELILNDLPNVGMTGDRLYRPMVIPATPQEWTAYTGSVLAIDPAGRGKDEVGYAVVKILHGCLFVTEWGGLNGGYEDATLKQLALIARRQKVNAVIVEQNFGDGMFTKLLTPFLTAAGHPVTIEEVHHSVQKERRIIDTLEPVLNTHKLVLDARLVRQDYDTVGQYASEIAHQYMGLWQLTRITRDRGSLKHDDRLDALAIAVAYWVEHMARDSDDALREHREALLDADLRKFLDSIEAGEPQQLDSWISSHGQPDP